MKCKVVFYDETFDLDVLFHKYHNGRTAVVLFDYNEGEQFGKLTVNADEIHLEPNEILVKTWSENEEWYRQVLEQLPEVFQDTGKIACVGYAQAEIWTVTTPANTTEVK